MFACVKKFSGLLMSVTECFSFIYTVRLIFDLSGKVMQEGAIGWEHAFCTNCVQDRVTFLSLSIYIAIGIFSLGSGDDTIYTYIYISGVGTGRGEWDSRPLKKDTKEARV